MRSNRLFYLIADVVLTNCAFVCSLLLRFDGKVPEQYILVYFRYGFLLSAVAVFVFACFNLYSNLWQYASVYEIINIFMAVSLFSLISWSFFLLVPEKLPRSVYVIEWGMLLFFIGGIRLFHRLHYPWRQIFHRHKSESENNLLLIGAGQAGSMVIKELFEHPRLGYPVAIIDEDSIKTGCRVHGVPVVGTMKDLDAAIKKFNIKEILVAIPSASETDIRRILNQCKETGCKLKRLPGIFSIINGKISIRQMRDVNIADLLGRPEVTLDMDSICSYIKDQVVLVTGAGGSIGSELCRQIARFGPKQLIMLDNYENNLYQLQLELLHTKIQLHTLIGSVQDEMRIDSILAEYKPQVVFHAAAHKHVPLMEDSPSEAIKNNIFGTINVAKAADRHNVKKFIFISTDKAVNPSSVMGASKRVAEIAIQQINKKSKTQFAAVRFGNVLGSNGSVIPIFQRQIMPDNCIWIQTAEHTS